MTDISILKVAVLDWAGTLVDFGSRAPVLAFVDLMGRYGITVSEKDVRKFMGLNKKEHLSAILRLPNVLGAWRELHGAKPSDEDLLRLYSEFVPVQLGAIQKTSSLIRGVKDAIAGMRSAGMAITTTTGYDREMADAVLQHASMLGLVPDASSCVSDVDTGRPSAQMINRNLGMVGGAEPWQVVKIGDTSADIAEGLTAGAWTIGLISCGNMVGLAEHEWELLDQGRRDGFLAAGRDRFSADGAHYTADDWFDVLAILADINKRLVHGERP